MLYCHEDTSLRPHASFLLLLSLLPLQVHWFSIINSILIVLFLAFMVAMILIRALNRDISKYNRVSDCFSPDLFP